MDMRQPAQLVYGRAEDMPAAEESTGLGTQLALLALVLALAAATVGYLVHPAFRQTPPPVARSCEVIVLSNGSPDCVAKPARASATTTSTSTGRSKQPSARPAGGSHAS